MMSIPEYNSQNEFLSNQFDYTNEELEGIYEILRPYFKEKEQNPEEKEELLQLINGMSKSLCIERKEELNGITEKEFTKEVESIKHHCSSLISLLEKVSPHTLDALKWEMESLLYEATKNEDNNEAYWDHIISDEEDFDEYDYLLPLPKGRIRTSPSKLANSLLESCEVVNSLIGHKEFKVSRGRPKQYAVIRYVWRLFDLFHLTTGLPLARRGVFDNFLKTCITPPSERENLFIQTSEVDQYIREFGKRFYVVDGLVFNAQNSSN